jgi:hypothetical protein
MDIFGQQFSLWRLCGEKGLVHDAKDISRLFQCLVMQPADTVSMTSAYQILLNQPRHLHGCIINQQLKARMAD